MTDYYAWNSTLRASTKPMKRSALHSRGKHGSMFPKRRDRPYTEWIKTLPCVLFGTPFGHECCDTMDPAHVFKTRAVGAYDRGETVPLCRIHHRQQEGRTAAFMIETGVNVRRIAKDLLEWYEEDHG